MDFLAGSSSRTALDTATKYTISDYLSVVSAGSRSVFNHHLSALRAFYDWLFSDVSGAVNPARLIKRVKVFSKKRIPLSLPEFILLLQAASGGTRRYRTRNRALIQVGFFSALRVSELASLSVSQLDVVGRLVVNIPTKGSKWQSLRLPPAVFETLLNYLDERSQFGPTPDEDALFLSDRGTRLSVRQIEEIVRGLAKVAEIPRSVSPHLLRHSVATALAERGVSLWALQNLLNHESIAATARYIHVSSELTTALAALDNEVTELIRRSSSSAPRKSSASGAPAWV